MEEWKDIEGWEGKYQVSNYGDIKRLERDITDSLGRTKHYTEKIFHPHKANNGYTRGMKHIFFSVNPFQISVFIIIFFGPCKIEIFPMSIFMIYFR